MYLIAAYAATNYIRTHKNSTAGKNFTFSNNKIVVIIE